MRGVSQHCNSWLNPLPRPGKQRLTQILPLICRAQERSVCTLWFHLKQKITWTPLFYISVFVPVDQWCVFSFSWRPLWNRHWSCTECDVWFLSIHSHRLINQNVDIQQLLTRQADKLFCLCLKRSHTLSWKGREPRCVCAWPVPWWVSALSVR